MILKNPMEEKQLNFNQPLLSVRRGSSRTTPPEVHKRRTDNCPSNLPPLPYYRSELKSGPVRNPGAVPFQWEQTPGKPKDESKEQTEIPEQLPLAPKLPPGRIPNHKQKSTDESPKDSPGSSSRSQGENNTACSPEISSIKKVLSELKAEENEKKNEAISSSEDENVTYLDARDALSRTESFFLNCSVSGVSVLDGANAKPSGVFSDPQIRDFMMGRFLPAAKAVASEAPQFASKKQSVAREQSKPINKVVKNKGSPIYYDVHNVSLHNIHGEGEDEEEDDKGDEYEGPGDLSAKLCGLLPRFCLLNPIPGMREHAQIIRQVRSVSTKPVYSAGSIKNENKDRLANNRGEVRRITCQNGHANKSSLNGHFGWKTITPSKDGSPQPFLGIERGFLGFPEEHRDFRVKVDVHRKGLTRLKELLADHATDGIASSPSSVNPIIERTLYIDSEQSAESWNSNSSSSESRGRTPSVDYSLQDVQSHCAADEKAIPQPKSSDTVDSGVLSTSERPSQNTEQDLVKDSRKDRDLSLAVHTQQPENPDLKESTQKSNPPLMLAPLLPKSPSESWLSRTLSSISSQNPTSKTYIGNPAFKSSPLDPRQSGVLRTSNRQHSLFLPSLELAPILEN